MGIVGMGLWLDMMILAVNSNINAFVILLRLHAFFFSFAALWAIHILQQRTQGAVVGSI